MAKEVTARKHLIARGWKLIRNADINISSSISTAVSSVDYLNPFDNDSCAVVNGDPGCRFVCCGADCDGSVVSVHRLRVSVNTFACYICNERNISCDSGSKL